MNGQISLHDFYPQATTSPNSPPPPTPAHPLLPDIFATAPNFDAPKFPKLSAVEWNFWTTFPPAITGFDEFQPVVTEDPIGDNSDRI